MVYLISFRCKVLNERVEKETRSVWYTKFVHDMCGDEIHVGCKKYKVIFEYIKFSLTHKILYEAYLKISFTPGH